jgi:hypothetical protein
MASGRSPPAVAAITVMSSPARLPRISGSSWLGPELPKVRIYDRALARNRVPPVGCRNGRRPEKRADKMMAGGQAGLRIELRQVGSTALIGIGIDSAQIAAQRR